MARFFLHVRHRNELITDPDGEEFPHAAAALAGAREAARALAAEDVRQGRPLSGREIHVWDEQGHAVGRVPLLSVVKI